MVCGARRFHPAGLAGVNPVIPRFFKRLLLVCVLVLAAVYGSDYLFLRVRMVSKFAGEPFETVTIYEATATKNGRVEIFFDRPLQEVCVRSLFPHLGDTPCWYLNRSHIKLIAMAGERRIVAQAIIDFPPEPAPPALAPRRPHRPREYSRR